MRSDCKASESSCRLPHSSGLFPGSGFTLIELLIVVAIIAILAAISVPNLLEAQNRSKVVRTISDMRSLGLAVASYSVDYNGPPRPNNHPGASTGVIMIYNMHPFDPASSSTWMGRMLTTPVEYISRIPGDYWNTRMIRESSHSRWGWDYEMSFLGTYVPNMTAELHGSGYTWKDWWEIEFMASQGYTEPDGDFRYAFYSAGPDLAWWNTDPDGSGPLGAEFFYDPTNGTISPGDLWYFSHRGNIPSLAR